MYVYLSVDPSESLSIFSVYLPSFLFSFSSFIEYTSVYLTFAIFLVFLHLSRLLLFHSLSFTL